MPPKLWPVKHIYYLNVIRIINNCTEQEPSPTTTTRTNSMTNLAEPMTSSFLHIYKKGAFGISKPQLHRARPKNRNDCCEDTQRRGARDKLNIEWKIKT